MTTLPNMENPSPFEPYEGWQPNDLAEDAKELGGCRFLLAPFFLLMSLFCFESGLSLIWQLPLWSARLVTALVLFPVGTAGLIAACLLVFPNVFTGRWLLRSAKLVKWGLLLLLTLIIGTVAWMVWEAVR